MKELFYFLGILGVVICGYGVASRSMYFYQIENNLTTARNGTYDTKFDGRNIFRQVIYPVYYFLHGEIGGELEDLDRMYSENKSCRIMLIYFENTQKILMRRRR